MTAFIIILIAAVLVLAGLYAAYYRVFYSPKKDMSETESPEIIASHPCHDEVTRGVTELSELPCQFLKTRSRDGLRLSARYFEGDPDQPLIICFHGYHGSALRDFAGLAPYLIHQGCSLLMVDERAHWRSQGHTIAFGIKERFDVLSWVEYANRRFGADREIFLLGISMGGGTVLMASGQQLPENVKGIIADCPYNSPKDIIKHVCRKVKLNPTLLWPVIWLSALVWGRFNVNATTAAKEAKNSKTPIIILHGEGDDFVPAYMSKEVAAANPTLISMHTFPEAGHGLSYFYDTKRYRSLVDEFIKANS